MPDEYFFYPEATIDKTEINSTETFNVIEFKYLNRAYETPEVNFFPEIKKRDLETSVKIIPDDFAWNNNTFFISEEFSDDEMLSDDDIIDDDDDDYDYTTNGGNVGLQDDMWMYEEDDDEDYIDSLNHAMVMHTHFNYT